MDSKKSRRKSASPATTVKSPCIKRCEEAPVTLHGWLFKQGSDGLMLWKKRWFVLSEYCLFYYKGPDEDKVLGSILLPSYTICPLSKEDGVYRKYAFKAEHANMRTYYFAAETKDSMIQWMNSLSLASILQNENNLRPEMLGRQLGRQGRSGRPNHPFHPVGHQPNGVPPMNNPQFNQSYDSSGSMLHPPENETRQPLYANAPPKPKRLNTSRDYSPSPEPSPDRSAQQHFEYPETQGEIPHHERSEDPSQFRHRLPQERRTPEAYGRSNVKHRVPKDYEEVYNNSFGESDRNSINSRRYSEEIMKYNRDSYASSQVHHNRRSSAGNYATDRELAEADMHAVHQSRQLSRNQYHQQHQDYQHSPQRPQSEYYPPNHGLPQHNGHIPRNAAHHEGSTNPRVPRPHSADFLEYEKKNGPLPAQEINSQARQDGKKIQPPRPKSTIGSPLRKPDDFWSEEVYAQKMRESAFMYDQSGSRSQSRASHRPPIPRSSTAPLSGPMFKEEKQPPTNHGRANVNNSSVPDENMHPLQISPDRNSVHTDQSPRFPQQLTPPIYYQDKSPSSQTQFSPANHQHQSPNGEVAQLTNAQYYSPNQSFGSSVHPPISPYHGNNSNNQPVSPHQQQPAAHHQQMSPQNQQFNHKLPLQQMSPQKLQQHHYQQQMMLAHKKATTYHHQMSPQQLQFSPHHQQMPPHNQQQTSPHNQQISPHHPQLPPHHMQMNHHQQSQHDYQEKPQYAQQIAQYDKHNNQIVSQPMPSSHVQHVVSQHLPNNQFRPPPHHQHPGEPSPMHQYQENSLFSSNDPKITAPPSIPQPTPRKQNNHTPTMYQNIPPNSVAAKSQSDPRHGPGSSRVETATPNRLSEKFDSDRSNDSDFRRTSSARLPRHKTRMNDIVNNTTQEESDEGKRPQTSDQREESMKRLLEWKQRMLQSPLTRKTFRNTSRTQTPTNSDSPVPSLHNAYIRERVLEELNNNPDSAPNQPPKERERRLSRKGSSGSRSSRSRSSPRIAASKGISYSSDEEDIVDSRHPRKRSKSQQSGRSRNSSKESRRSQSTKSEVSKPNSRTNSTNSPNPDQPEYMNIGTLRAETKEKSLVSSEIEKTARKLSAHNAIGPDDWYRDDFNFDKSQPFLDDPMLLKQYAQILDMKYRDSSTERIEEILKQPPLLSSGELDYSMYGGQSEHSRNRDGMTKVNSSQDRLSGLPPNVGHGAPEFSHGRYPDSGYDTLRMDLKGVRPQLCVNVDADNENIDDQVEKRGKDRRSEKEERKVHTWHSRNFADFQLMDKGDETVFLSIEGHPDDLQRTSRRSPRGRESDKVDWLPSKSFQDIRKEMEAPPKNLVKDRLKNFQPNQDSRENQSSPLRSGNERRTTPSPSFSFDDIDSALANQSSHDKSLQQESQPALKSITNSEEVSESRRKVSAKMRQSGFEEKRRRTKSESRARDSSCSDDDIPSPSKTLEKKRSVKDLLSDFEKKSKELHEKEDKYRGIGSYLLQDSREGGGRRVFSDTETLMYETSSDEMTSDDSPMVKPESRSVKRENIQIEKISSIHCATENDQLEKMTESHIRTPSQTPSVDSASFDPPPLPPKKPPPSPKKAMEEFVLLDDGSEDVSLLRKLCTQERDYAGLGSHQTKPKPPAERPPPEPVVEETYLAMTPSRSLASLQTTPAKKNTLTLSTHNSRTSLSSSTHSHGSSQSLGPMGTLPRFGSDKNLGGMTPTEALIHSATASANHSRTPSQTVVMEHLQQELVQKLHFEDETYVEMNEDGSFVRTPREKLKTPVLAKQSLDTTLTYESPESPRYCEITEEKENSHYEYLYKARTATPQQYEVVYQEICNQGTDEPDTGTIKENKKKSSKKREPEPLRPIEGLPDILGNAPTNKGNSSSDADDESSKDFDAIEPSRIQQFTLDDSFRPASFYLSKSKSNNDEDGDDSSDSDLVSPPPVPSSPPPMEEVLGLTANAYDLDIPNPPANLSNVLTAAKSAQALRERSRRDSQESPHRRPSVGSRTSFGSQHSGYRETGGNGGFQQSLNRDGTLRTFGSQQSICSRELPPTPDEAGLRGSQQSLASKEIQQHISSSQQSLPSIENSYRNSPFTSPFASGQDTSTKQISSDDGEFSASEAANLMQEFRGYHLENIQEVSNTLERESGSHNTSIISQDLNISYSSVYDQRLQQSKVYKIEDHPVLQKRKSLDERQNKIFYQPDPQSKEIENEMIQNVAMANDVSSPRSKVPYYVSDTIEDTVPNLVSGRKSVEFSMQKKSSVNESMNTTERAKVVDSIENSMKMLDERTNDHFFDKNASENEKIRKLRRSYTPDPYLTKSNRMNKLEEAQKTQFDSNNVSRSRSLEGLLGDSQGGPKDNIGYVTQPRMYSPHSVSDIPPPANPKPARGHQPPPPPAGVPPLDLRPLASPIQTMSRQSMNFTPNHTDYEHNEDVDDDEMWAENLRKASRKQRARSIDNQDDLKPKQGTPPATAPKPKTPVHMIHNDQEDSCSSQSFARRGPVNYYSKPENTGVHQARMEPHKPQSEYYHGQNRGMVSPTKPKGEFQSNPQMQIPKHHQMPGHSEMSSRHFNQQEHNVDSQNIYQNTNVDGYVWNEQEQKFIPDRNLSPRNQANFLELGLPNPTFETQTERRSVSRPASRASGDPQWMGRQQNLHTDNMQTKSMTLPARIKYTQEYSPNVSTSFELENSPRTRTSKSGLIYENSLPVPYSPSPTPTPSISSGRFGTDRSPGSVNQHNNHQMTNQTNSLPRDSPGRYIPKDAAETRPRRRSNSTTRKTDLETLKAKLRGNLANITAGDLLGKSHEELVLILIQLRRQSASLAEAIDACRAELDNMRNTGEQQGGVAELRNHTRELEGQHAKVVPIINLVDNMVKLGSLYRGPTEAPMSHRIRNSPAASPNRQGAALQKEKQAEIQGLLDRSLNDAKTKATEDTTDQESFLKHQKLLEKELVRVQTQLKLSHKKLDESGGDMSRLEYDMQVLRQELQASAQRDMNKKDGTISAETLTIEAELAEVQQQASELQRRRHNMMQEIQNYTQKESFLTNEIRPSPTGVAGAEPIPQRKRVHATWLESDIDEGWTMDRGPEVDEQVKKESQVNARKNDDAVPVYVNTYEEEKHNYENYENFFAQAATNPYEDDVQTVHSEGVRSESEGPPALLPRFKKNEKGYSDDDVIIGLGDISEADERVQRFYGIIPKEKPSEIKTVRMVKRDHKERSSRTKKGNEDGDSESVDLSLDEEEQPPPPLPRGNYQNMHNFLTNQPYESNGMAPQGNGYEEQPTYNQFPEQQPTTQIQNNGFASKSLPRTYGKWENGLPEKKSGGSQVFTHGQTQQGGTKANFRLGEYYKSPRENTSRPGSSLSAHERLFGTSREESISPPETPSKTNSINSTDSMQSALMSPVFKSAAARAIIEEERKTPMIIPKAGRRNKKRHMTITSSHPSVIEALNNHEKKVEANRSRDDLDIERVLKPRDAPDVVRSTYTGKKDSKISVSTIDNLFGVPDKIKIPERYIPDVDMENQTPEERQTRLKKADSIRRMLADSTATPIVARGETGDAKTQMTDEKNQRGQLLALNQVLARQVMEKSRMVAGHGKE